MVKTWVALSILLLCSYRAGSRPTRPLPAQKFCDLDSAGGERRDSLRTELEVAVEVPVSTVPTPGGEWSIDSCKSVKEMRHINRMGWDPWKMTVSI